MLQDGRSTSETLTALANFVSQWLQYINPQPPKLAPLKASRVQNLKYRSRTLRAAWTDRKTLKAETRPHRNALPHARPQFQQKLHLGYLNQLSRTRTNRAHQVIFDGTARLPVRVPMAELRRAHVDAPRVVIGGPATTPIAAVCVLVVAAAVGTARQPAPRQLAPRSFAQEQVE